MQLSRFEIYLGLWIRVVTAFYICVDQTSGKWGGMN